MDAAAPSVANWVAIYLLTAWLCLVAAILAAMTVCIDASRHDARPRTFAEWIVFTGTLWWRWQLRYWIGTPAIVAIVGAFGASLDWSGGSYPGPRLELEADCPPDRSG